MRFEWDDEKERKNIAKHGIDFTTASYVFGDENRLDLYDEKHSENEERYVTIGLIKGIALCSIYRKRRNYSGNIGTKSDPAGKENVR